jgi:hypothetical protein
VVHCLTCLFCLLVMKRSCNWCCIIIPQRGCPNFNWNKQRSVIIVVHTRYVFGIFTVVTRYKQTWMGLIVPGKMSW